MAVTQLATQAHLVCPELKVYVVNGVFWVYKIRSPEPPNLSLRGNSKMHLCTGRTLIIYN